MSAVPAETSRWVLRPGRSLAVLQAAALWPVWIGALCFDRVLRNEPTSLGADIWVYRIAAMIVGLCALAAYVGRHPRGLASSATVGTAPMDRLIGLGLLVALAGVRWRGPELDAMVLGGIASAIGGGVYLALGATVSRWPGGVLRQTETGPVLDGAKHRYVLGEWPGECAEGETLWLPALETFGSGDGPYRRGRVLGRSAVVIRDHDGTLVQRLVQQGVLLEAWALTTFAWVMLSQLG
ncbi:MAG: hypothetical protein JJ863_13095 [Deltaproteobacteria bacterium]|nr:hypothetical protein [Deltaproteobacteria bacterium]